MVWNCSDGTCGSSSCERCRNAAKEARSAFWTGATVALLWSVYALFSAIQVTYGLWWSTVVGRTHWDIFATLPLVFLAAIYLRRSGSIMTHASHAVIGGGFVIVVCGIALHTYDIGRENSLHPPAWIANYVDNWAQHGLNLVLVGVPGLMLVYLTVAFIELVRYGARQLR